CSRSNCTAGGQAAPDGAPTPSWSQRSSRPSPAGWDSRSGWCS
ncbi:MAG: hypothetical protein AVDCRST_MAG49-3589, partial [uncultured Thermomicrobiales bacterium]